MTGSRSDAAAEVDPRIVAYGRGVASEVVAAVSAEFPRVTISARDYDSGVWLSRVEFVPATREEVPVWLVVNRDQTFVVAAGENYRWDEEFIPELRQQQVGVILDEIRDFALHGLVTVRANRLLGVYSSAVVGTAEDEVVTAAMAKPFARELERFSGWS